MGLHLEAMGAHRQSICRFCCCSCVTVDRLIRICYIRIFIVNFFMNFHELCSILLLDDILHLWYFPDGRNDVFAKLSFLASESAIEQIQWLMVQCGLYQFSQELCSLQQIIVFK